MTLEEQERLEQQKEDFESGMRRYHDGQEKARAERKIKKMTDAAKNKKANLIKHSKILLQACLDSGVELEAAKKICAFIRLEKDLIINYYNCY